MEETSVFNVEKFIPSRCPNCEEAFSSPSSFAEYRGNEGASVESEVKFPRLFPEIYGSYRDEGSEVRYTNRFDAGFVVCRTCDNVTLRLQQKSRRVMSRHEAERLVEEEGFTFWSEGKAAGNMAEPSSRLAFLGKVDPEQQSEN